ncbi:MAG: hypothetical protein ACI841_003181 [Planctomycetota bacterium]|jgi:hypothetical protein
MKLPIARLIFPLLVVSALALSVTRIAWPALKWRFAGPSLDWPSIDSYELHADVSRLGTFGVEATLELSDIAGTSFTLLLNDELIVREATAGEVPVQVHHFWRLPSRYHTEGRVIQIQLPSAPEGGRLRLHLSYGGDAEKGRKGSDWRGILYVGESETRMCEQTIFYPQVPLTLEGAAKVKAPYAMSVLAPEEWEIFVPAPGGVVKGRPDQAEGTRRWEFRTERAGAPSLLGGLRERAEADVQGTRIVTLLRSEHADLASDFILEASLAIDAYTKRFGAIDAGVVGVIEIGCRDSSYNWTADGVLAFDRGALSGRVPVAKVAHEVAHLWWGQVVEATGPGERFLTEGLAEFSSWSYLLDAGRADLVGKSIVRANGEVAVLTDAGQSEALSEVVFGSKNYMALAYGKGALVLHNLRSQLEPGRLDAVLRELVDVGRERKVTLADFNETLQGSGGQSIHVPWLSMSGDLDLAVGEVELSDGAFSLTVTARPIPSTSPIDATGAPLAVLFGGRGWVERRSVTLVGESTQLQFETGGRELCFVKVDPDRAWTRSISKASSVLNGAQLLDARPAHKSKQEFGGTLIELQFDSALAPIDLGQLQSAQLSPPPSGFRRLDIRGAVLSDAGRSLSLETDVWLPDFSYLIALDSLRDLEALPLLADSYAFQVLPSTDVTGPRIVASVPESGSMVASDDGLLTLSVTFDERMQYGQAITGEGVRDIKARGFAYPKLDGFGEWDELGRTLRYRCSGLVPGMQYALPIRARGFRDLTGNKCEDFDLIFSIAQKQ